MTTSSPRSSRIRSLRSLASAVTLTTTVSLHAQFNAIGFEGQTIQSIPYDTSIGIPAGKTANQPFSYTLASGNNLQSFQSGNNTVAGGFYDTDDKYSGSATTTSVPDYYRSPEFLWRVDGFKDVTPTGTNPGWDTGFLTGTTKLKGSNASAVGTGGYTTGDNQPQNQPTEHSQSGVTGATAMGVDGTTRQFSEQFNINRDYSPAAGNLPKAPGLGDQFLDTHLTVGASSQFSLSFNSNVSQSFYATFAFGGRDSGSDSSRAYFRIIDTAGSVLVTGSDGSTNDTPFESWTGPLAAPVTTTTYAATGVTQANWEYFKKTFSLVAGHNYKLQIMMPNEINFDMVIGTNYTNISSITGGNLTPVPEAASYGIAGVGLAAGFALLRRRRSKPRSA